MRFSGKTGVDAPAEEAVPAHCDHPGCDGAATHRAPKGRERLNEFYWFCLDHIREYNRRWNYCADMDARQIELEIRNDSVWRRPTWPFSGAYSGPLAGSTPGPGDYHFRARFRDDLGLFESTAWHTAAGDSGARRNENQPDARVARALRMMDLDRVATLTELKSRYKELVKRLHPDINGGDTAAEDALKGINEAYDTLKKFIVA